MSKGDEKFRKKNYTDFDARLDQALDEELEERQRQIQKKAPDLEGLSRQVQEGTQETGLADRLKDACYYYLCYELEKGACHTADILKEALRGYGSLRGDLLDLAGLAGCLAFKRAMPQAGEAYALTVLEGLQYLGPEETDWLDKGFSALRNIANTAVRMRQEEAVLHIVQTLETYRQSHPDLITPGFLALLQDFLFLLSDRRQKDALVIVGYICREVLLRPSVAAKVRKSFALDWSALAAQIAQRNWEAETDILLKNLCLFASGLQDPQLLRMLLGDFAIHIQMHSHWDSFEAAFKLYYPCHLLLLSLYRRAMRRYRLRPDQADEDTLDMLCFLLRTARDMVANSARLMLKEEWEIYISWRRIWLAASHQHVRRQKKIREFLQLTAEYWHQTQPSSSRRQWPRMAEVLWPPQLAQPEMELLKRLP